jgi:hypothetical protein
MGFSETQAQIAQKKLLNLHPCKTVVVHELYDTDWKQKRIL